MEWGSSNFVNPPYGRELPKWIKKGWEESRKGKQCVFLIPSRTDTRYWHEYVMRAEEIRFIKGRLKFKGAENSAPFPSCIVIFNPEHNGGNKSMTFTEKVMELFERFVVAKEMEVGLLSLAHQNTGTLAGSECKCHDEKGVVVEHLKEKPGGLPDPEKEEPAADGYDELDISDIQKLCIDRNIEGLKPRQRKPTLIAKLRSQDVLKQAESTKSAKPEAKPKIDKNVMLAALQDHRGRTLRRRHRRENSAE